MTAEIICTNCKQSFKTSANSVIINHYFSGRIKVETVCPCCKELIPVDKTPEISDLLKVRLDNSDYDVEIPYDPIVDAYVENMQQ